MHNNTLAARRSIDDVLIMMLLLRPFPQNHNKNNNNMKPSSSSPKNFAWGLNTCLLSGVCGLFLDLVPEDGVLKELSSTEEALFGQSIEKQAQARVSGFGTVSRIHCGPHMSPELFYVAVAHAVRTVANCVQQRTMLGKKDVDSGLILSSASNIPMAVNTSTTTSSPTLASTGKTTNSPPTSLSGLVAQQQQQNNNNNNSTTTSTTTTTTIDKKNIIFAPHIFIVQDVDRAPARTLECLTELLTIKVLSAPPGASAIFLANVGGVVPEQLQIPSHFVVIATSSALPRPSATTTFLTNPQELRLSDRFLHSFLLRIPLILPSVRPPPYVPFDVISESRFKTMLEEVDHVYISTPIVQHVRSVFSAIRSHPFVACGVPPRAWGSLLSCMKVQAVLQARSFVIPQDCTVSILATLAHRIIVVPSKVLPMEYADEHSVHLARLIIASCVSSVPVVR